MLRTTGMWRGPQEELRRRKAARRHASFRRRTGHVHSESVESAADEDALSVALR